MTDSSRKTVLHRDVACNVPPPRCVPPTGHGFNLEASAPSGVRTNRLRCLALVVAWIFVYPISVNADTPASPTDYVIETGDGKHVFVMLGQPEHGVWRACSKRFKNFENYRSSDEFKACLSAGRPRNEMGERYPRSGLYRKGGGIVPEWTVNWYAFGVYLSDDGQYLARMGPWASYFEDLAIAFYRNGQTLSAYPISALVSDPNAVSRSISHFMWRRSISYDSIQNRLTLTTLGNDEHVFDMYSGALISSTQIIPPAYSVGVRTDKEGVFTVENLRPCRGGYETIRQRTQKGGDGPALVGYVAGKSSSTGSSKFSYLDLYSIPLSQVRFAERISVISNEKVVWRIHLKSKQKVDLKIDPVFMVLCGTRAGKEITLEPNNVSRLEILGRTDGRTVMREDIADITSAASRSIVRGGGITSLAPVEEAMSSAKLPEAIAKLAEVIPFGLNEPVVKQIINRMLERMAEDFQAEKTGQPRDVTASVRNAFRAVRRTRVRYHAKTNPELEALREELTNLIVSEMKQALEVGRLEFAWSLGSSALGGGGSSKELTELVGQLKQKRAALAREEHRARSEALARANRLARERTRKAPATSSEDKVLRQSNQQSLANQTRGKTSCPDSWSIEIPAKNIPDTPLCGQLFGREFVLDSAHLSRSTLKLISGDDIRSRQEITIWVGEDQLDKEVLITSTFTGNFPQVSTRFRDATSNRSRHMSFPFGYSLRILPVSKKGADVNLKLHLSLPDYQHSFLMGALTVRSTSPRRLNSGFELDLSKGSGRWRRNSPKTIFPGSQIRQSLGPYLVIMELKHLETNQYELQVSLSQKANPSRQLFKRTIKSTAPAPLEFEASLDDIRFAGAVFTGELKESTGQ